MDWDDKELFIKNSKHCNVCYKPTKYPICPNCLFKLKYRGGGSHQVTPKDMFKSVIRYQQTLSFKFMGYGVSKQYRAPKEDRLGDTLNKETINESLRSLRYSALEPKSGCAEFQNVFEDVFTDTLNRRLLLYATLWHIAYHKNLYRFESESHFKGSMVTHLISCVNKAYYKKYRQPSPATKRVIAYKLPFDYHKHLFKVYNLAVTPLLIEL